MNQEIKREIILDNVKNPYHKEVPNNVNDYVMVNTANVSCIDNLDLYIKKNKEIIESIYFSGEACAISTSTTSIMAKLLEDKTIAEALKIVNNYIYMINEEEYDKSLLDDAIIYEDIYKQPNRKKCALLTWEGIKKILEESI